MLSALNMSRSGRLLGDSDSEELTLVFMLTLVLKKLVGETSSSSMGLFSSKAERMVRLVFERVTARRDLLVATILKYLLLVSRLLVSFVVLMYVL